MVPTERPRCFESFARALLALSFLLHRHLLLSSLSALRDFSSFSPSLFSSLSFFSFLALPLSPIDKRVVTVTRLFALPATVFTALGKNKYNRDGIVRGGVKQHRNIGYRGQQPLSNDFCVNCRGQESEAKGIPMERFLIESRMGE